MMKVNKDNIKKKENINPIKDNDKSKIDDKHQVQINSKWKNKKSNIDKVLMMINDLSIDEFILLYQRLIKLWNIKESNLMSSSSSKKNNIDQEEDEIKIVKGDVILVSLDVKHWAKVMINLVTNKLVNNLPEAKKLISNVPSILKSGVLRSEYDDIVKIFKKKGVNVDIQFKKTLV